MQSITAREVVEAVKGELLAGDLDAKITGVSADTRTIAAGDLFVALTGENSDGHKFLADALERGAVGVMVSCKVEAQCLAIRVPDTLTALGDLAAHYRSRYCPIMVGVTGSVGKTTTKEMIAAVAAARGPVLKNEGNFNNEIGLPLTLFNLAPRHKICVAELAMRGAGQIDYLARIARPSIGVITNIQMSHIELLGSLDAIADAKAELLDHLPGDGSAILNADDPYFDYLSRRANCRVIPFGEGPNATVRATSMEIDPAGCCSFNVATPLGSFDVHIPVPGEHNIKDALAAIAVGEVLGIDHESIRSALAGFKAPEKRSKIVPSRKGFVVIDDTYNAGPASVKSALKTLSMMQGGRRIAILGDMLELGEYATQAHIEIGRIVQSLGIDMLIVVGEHAKLIAKGALEAGLPIEAICEYEDSLQAAKEIPAAVRENDVALVKGSRALKMERIVEELIDA
ncbi:MAG: UDP-N-acetylmuramoyl-tripeptide--D-alanyl-D-alanine ligase [Armatimonadetes bacterium]|jgi:UDP-N-acetylmuramoyl-tripeptide--D-alanyl-D-alanine ligase|nr:UDP-N-acetylmuramoyl-tripeptide--D-alanyl-D-alanine ligase [Armatimonadota bacterium]